MAEGEFKKPFSLGLNVEQTFFSEDGSTGFSLSAWGGYLSLSFWKKGEKSKDNRDNKLSLNVLQGIVLGKHVANILKIRKAQFEAGGAEGYAELPESIQAITGFVNGQKTEFGRVKFGTTDVDGIKRIQMTVIRGETVNTIVFCDKQLADLDTATPDFYDVYDTSFEFFGRMLEEWVNNAWNQSAFNKIAAKQGGNIGEGGNSGGYQKPSGGYQKPNNNNRYNSGGNSSNVYDDGDDLSF